MSRVTSLPYLMPLRDRIEIVSWYAANSEDGADPLPRILPDWDPAVPIEVEALVIIDVQGIFEDCRLGSDAVLRLASSWESQGSGLKGRGTFRDFSYQDTKQTVTLSISTDGTNLARDIDISVLLVLQNPGSDPQPFAPRLVGSTLFRSVHSVQLEGEGSRFPTEVIDFSETSYPNDAGWVLDWDPSDLEQSVMGDLRLYINARHERIRQAVATGSDEGLDIRETIRIDVARTLIYGALRNDQFVQYPQQYRAGSVGSAVFNMLHLYFPQYDVQELRNRIEQPQSFEPQLQAKLRIFWNDKR